ncbi:MAG: hypothetical protein ACXAD7_22125 [Candidatus Kariarchaeaceae archaeon]
MSKLISELIVKQEQPFDLEKKILESEYKRKKLFPSLIKEEKENLDELRQQIGKLNLPN